MESTSAPTGWGARKAAFGSLETNDVVSLVARRLRAAIGLGILSDGDKLPKERDLARQLGVTTFSLREGLGRLREEGLIVTRAGKMGGSVVRTGPGVSLSLGADGLRQLSAVDLRELGDWRRMLSAEAASLAAVRGSQSSATRLADLAAEMAEADSARVARGVLGRFNLELAAAAQSMRLNRAELTMHEEFDWLVTVLVGEPGVRAELGRQMAEVARAVAKRDHRTATESAAAMIRFLVSGLAGARLSLLAQESSVIPLTDGAASLEEAVSRFLAGLVEDLSEVGRKVVPALRAGMSAESIHSQIATSVRSQLHRTAPAVRGMGVAVEPGLVAGLGFTLDWWQRVGEGGLVRDERHVLDPNRDDFYDYTTKDFFRSPRRTDEPCAIGPYVDYGGENDYLITVAVPLSDEGRFLGVVAADILVSELERVFSAWLAKSPEPFVLLDADQRVIVSNSVRYDVGSVLAITDRFHVGEVPMFGWLVAKEANES